MQPTSHNPITDPHPGDVIRLDGRLVVTVLAVGPDGVSCEAPTTGGMVVRLFPSMAEWKRCELQMQVVHLAD